MSVRAQTLNDTGVDYVGHPHKGVKTVCRNNDTEGSEFYSTSQDCSSGRDVYQNNEEDGLAGFSYKKLDINGKILESDSPVWFCVQDTVSGLTWEVKQTEKGLHFYGDRFTWYDSNKKSNGGHIGSWNHKGKHCFGYTEGKPRTYCHTEQFVSRVNKQGLCGFNDWRLPSREELTSLVNFGMTGPSIDTQYFPQVQRDFYWSASAAAGKNNQAWTISFEYGFTAPMLRTDTRFVRLVRAAEK